MIQNVKKYVKFITDNKLTQPEFLFLYILYRVTTYQEIELQETAELYAKHYPNDSGTMLSKHSIEKLIERGFIVIDENQVPVITEKFGNIFIDMFEAANELWNLYPDKAVSDGKSYPLKTMSKSDMRNIYASIINQDLEEHKEVVKDLKYAVENGQITTGIRKFIEAAMWEGIRKERNGTETIVNVEDFKTFG